MNKYFQCGTSLIEVMVTVLLLSIGLLGMASLQLKSMSLNRSSFNRIQAVNLAYEIADGIFLNSLAAQNQQYTLTLENTKPNASDNNSIAYSDVELWLKIVKNRLPQGDLEISAPIPQTGNVNSYNIYICWSDKNSNPNFDDASINPCTQKGLSSYEFITNSRI